MVDTKILFSHYEELVGFMCYAASRGKIVYLVTFYDDAREILKELSSIEETYIENIELTEPIYDGYDKEFYVVLNEDFGISVEKAFHEDNEYHKAGYLNFDIGEECITLIDGDANSEIIKAAGDNICYEYEINNEEDDDECDGNCAECEYSSSHKESDDDCVMSEEEVENLLMDFIKYIYSTREG